MAPFCLRLAEGLDQIIKVERFFVSRQSPHLTTEHFTLSEPKERAKDPGKGSSSLSEPRPEVMSAENASHDDIQRSCQQLIDDINAKRKRDTDLLNGTHG